MRKFLSILLVVSSGLVVGGLSFWMVRPNETREFAHLKAKALCVLDLGPESSIAHASFTTSKSIDELHVGVLPRRRGERFSLEVCGSERLACSATTDATRYSWKHELRPGTYQITLSQQAGNHGALVVIAAEKPIYLTGWQIWSRTFLGILALSAVWAAAARNSQNPRTRIFSLYLFQMLLLGFVMIFLYLLCHEGGHTIGELAFGRYDFARSDFWGIHGTPHSAGTSGPSLEPWQQAVISGAGPILPTLAGWALLLCWSSRFGRNMRDARPIINLYVWSAIAMLVFPLFALAGCLLGVISDGDWQGFITNVPRPLWLARGLLWGMLLINAVILWRVASQLRRCFLTVIGPMKEAVASQNSGKAVRLERPR